MAPKLAPQDKPLMKKFGTMTNPQNDVVFGVSVNYWMENGKRGEIDNGVPSSGV